MRLLTLVLCLLALAGAGAAQDAPPPLTADNVRDFKPARTVRYEEMLAFPTGEAAQPLSGWFTLSPDGAQAAFVVDGGVRIVGVAADDVADGGWVRAGATVIDARWDNAGNLAVISQQDAGYKLDVYSTALSEGRTLSIPSDGVPVRVWPDAENENFVWTEVTPAPENPDRSGFQVVRIDVSDPENPDPLTLPTGPEHDFDSFVRIGRIPAPLAITATFAGTVRRWDLQTGEITAEVALPLAPTFGRVNETNGVEFAWRDEASAELHLLNFETGEDRLVAPLNGEYVQALLLAPDASVILAVHRGDLPTVTAWIVETGEEIALGEYDTSICSRVPDMVQLARDGTRLVIGCDAGFQVWTVGEA